MRVVIIIHFLSSGNIFVFALTDRIVLSTVSSGGRSCLLVRIIIESKNRLLYYLKCIAVQLFSRIITSDSASVSLLLHFPPIISFCRRHSSLYFGILHILHCFRHRYISVSEPHILKADTGIIREALKSGERASSTPVTV